MEPTAILWMQEPMERDLVKLILRQSGFLVQPVEDTAMLLEVIRQKKPTLAFLDVLLSGANGIDLTAKIKTEMGDKSPAIALISALAFPEVISRACAAGTDEFFVRPLDGDLLRDRIQKMINRALSAGVKKPE